MKIAKHQKNQGFTLIEVLVALIVVSFGLLAIIQVTSNHIRNTSELEKRILASWVASNHLAQIRFDVRTNKIKTGGDTERFKMGGYQWRSRAKISETEVERVYLVEVEVSDEAERNKGNYASLTTAVTDQL